MVTVVQLVRASDCGSECRGFESHRSPKEIPCNISLRGIFCLVLFVFLMVSIVLCLFIGVSEFGFNYVLNILFFYTCLKGI